MSVSRPCEECSKVKRCKLYGDNARHAYLCGPCARELGYVGQPDGPDAPYDTHDDAAMVARDIEEARHAPKF